MKNHTSLDYTKEDHENSEPDFYAKWVSVKDRLPEKLGDYSVFVAFNNGSVEDMKMVHVEDWIVENKHPYVTHWMSMPNHPVIDSCAVAKDMAR